MFLIHLFKWQGSKEPASSRSRYTEQSKVLLFVWKCSLCTMPVPVNTPMDINERLKLHWPLQFSALIPWKAEMSLPLNGKQHDWSTCIQHSAHAILPHTEKSNWQMRDCYYWCSGHSDLQVISFTEKAYLYGKYIRRPSLIWYKNEELKYQECLGYKSDFQHMLIRVETHIYFNQYLGYNAGQYKVCTHWKWTSMRCYQITEYQINPRLETWGHNEVVTGQQWGHSHQLISGLPCNWTLLLCKFGMHALENGHLYIAAGMMHQTFSMELGTTNQASFHGFMVCNCINSHQMEGNDQGLFPARTQMIGMGWKIADNQ